MAANICQASQQDIANDRGSVTFPCPKCGASISRSSNARMIAMKYTCSKCGFTGPN